MDLRRKIALWICPELSVQTDNHPPHVYASEQGIIKIAQTYSSHTGLSLSTVATYAVQDGKFFTRLSKGGGCTLKMSSRIVQYFSDNWPEDLAWPEGIDRPAPTKKKVA